jgi:sulfonate transport system substrate-binding protein
VFRGTPAVVAEEPQPAAAGRLPASADPAAARHGAPGSRENRAGSRRRMRRARTFATTKGLRRLISPLVALALWQLAATSRLVSAQKLPPPSEIWSTAITLITTNSPAYGTLQGAMAVSLERVVFAAAGGDELAIVGATKTDPNDAALLVPKNSPIHTIAQLRGQKIGVAVGSSGDYHLLTVLDKAGLSVHDVSIEDLQPAEALAAFASGHLDAWDVWSPYIQQAVTQDGARILVNGTGFGSPYSFTVASRAALADPVKVTAIRDYLGLLEKAYIWADSHTAAWAKYWALSTGLPLSIMLKAAKDDTSTPVPITSAVIASEQQVSNAFTAAGLIPVHVDFAKFGYTGFNSILGRSSS